MCGCINQCLNATSLDGYGVVFAYCELVSNKTDYRMWSCVCLGGQIKQTIQLQAGNLNLMCSSNCALIMCSIVMCVSIRIRYSSCVNVYACV